MITEKDATELVDIIKKIDVKQMSIEHENTKIQKWFRFGNFNMAQIICEIIKQLPEAKDEGTIS